RTLKYFLAVPIAMLVWLLPFGSEPQSAASQPKLSGPLCQLIDREARPLSPTQRDHFCQAVTQVAKRYELDPLLVLAVIRVESGFRPQALSHRQARGLMQVRSLIGRTLAQDLRLRYTSETDLYDLRTNVLVGTHYLASLMKRYHQNVHLALTAYNLGPT